MNKIIIGLGNPGEKYKNTRHNAGFLLIDYLIEKFELDKSSKLKNSNFYKLRNGLVLIRPKTFMNNSGVAAREAIKWFDINVEEDLIVAHDDLDLPLGKYKYQFEKSPKDHNGVKSVENHIGTTKFHRLRIGVDNREGRNIDGERYVLKKMSDQEISVLNSKFSEIIPIFGNLE